MASSVPLALGEGADWCQNLRAAGGGVIRWNGNEHTVADPVVLEWSEARSAFTQIERAAVPLLGIEHFVRVRRVATEGGGPVPTAQESR